MSVSHHSPVNVQRLLKMNQQQKLIRSATSPFYASHYFTKQDLDGKRIIKMGKYSTIPRRKTQVADWNTGFPLASLCAWKPLKGVYPWFIWDQTLEQ